MDFGIFELIILSSIIQGLIFSGVVLLNKKYKSNTSKYISFFILLLSLSNLQYYFIENEYIKSSYVFIPWQWLIMPMFYFFIHKYLHKNIVNKTKIILFVPFFLIVLLHTIQVIFSFYSSYQLPTHYERGFFIYLDYCSFFFNLGILYVVYKKIKKFSLSNKKNKIYVEWILRLLYLGFAICLIWLIALSITLYLNEKIKLLFYSLWASISFLVYWVGYASIQHLTIKEERKNIKQALLKKETIIPSDGKINPIIAEFKSLIVNEELYLNPDLKQTDVAERLGITSNYLSKILKLDSKLNFNNFINQLRIEKAKELLVHQDFKNYTNIAIGLESGFNSKSTFFKAFKEHTNVSPRVYKEKQNI